MKSSFLPVLLFVASVKLYYLIVVVRQFSLLSMDISNFNEFVNTNQ